MSDHIILPNNQVIYTDSKLVSDGHHTFEELYCHRQLLYCAVMIAHKDLSWIATYHNDGTNYDGSFLAGMQLPQGQISYHLKNEYWYMLEHAGIKTYDFAPVWDGHTSDDVLARLEQFLTEI